MMEFVEIVLISVLYITIFVYVIHFALVKVFVNNVHVETKVLGLLVSFTFIFSDFTQFNAL